MQILLQSYNLLATLVFALVSAAVSVRLLLLARRTRCLPELLLGLGILGTAVLGYGLMIAALVLRGPENPVSTTLLERALHGGGCVFHDAGATMIIVFVAKVFRPGERWARSLAGALVLSLWLGMVGWEATNGFREAGIGNGFWWLRYSVIWSYSLWMMVESYAYYVQMRRRAALGLADALVANRFFLWGSASLGTTLATWSASIPFFLMDRPEVALAWMPAIQTTTASIGVATVAIYALTFFPPPAYRRWLTGAAR